MCTHTPQRKNSVTDLNFRIKQRKFPCGSVGIFHREKKLFPPILYVKLMKIIFSPRENKFTSG